MVYYKNKDIIIRDMEESDAQIFTDEFTAQGWHPDIATYQMRLKDQAERKCVALIAQYQGHPAGYVYVYRTPNAGPFKDKGWPEIQDFNVLEKYQRKGIGSKLMDFAELVSGKFANTVCLGVGLSKEYGIAQRMYIQRGFVPDGSGVWYKDEQCVQYETVCTVDDDLILYFYKDLSI
ncbi:MAG: GNAT family N-acetyltransferase [Spirochaetaceae bacterium]|nr:GNAT family N-acetyltransferase [Spirochaetaceae bacterium]